jgi:RNA polymerase sigma factor (sigma-70 family)
VNRINDEDTHRTIERVARESYGRLVAYLSVHTHDVAAAEDALSEALLKALTVWPRDGLPQNPEAWLLTAARNSIIDLIRHQRVVSESEPALLSLTKESAEMNWDTDFPDGRLKDERLKLLFVCAHPAIDPAMHTPLMLQTVLGLDAARIAGAFLISPKTMGQRLVRAKIKIRDGGIRFEIPDQRELSSRLDAVLEAIYAAFGIGWDDIGGVDQRGRDLAEEAIWLARVLLQLILPQRIHDEPEARGLLALMLYCESRRAARRGPDRNYIPLSEQDVQLWSKPLIAEAEQHLTAAFQRGRPGRFQLEAAIQSVHVELMKSGQTDWKAIAAFYQQLIGISPTLGRLTGYAAALAEASGPQSGLAVLDGLEPQAVSSYQPYWAVRAHLLQRLGKTSEARDAYDRAIGLAEDPAVRRFLLGKRG